MNNRHSSEMFANEKHFIEPLPTENAKQLRMLRILLYYYHHRHRQIK